MLCSYAVGQVLSHQPQVDIMMYGRADLHVGDEQIPLGLPCRVLAAAVVALEL